MMEVISVSVRGGRQRVKFRLDYLPAAKGRTKISTIGGYPRAFTPKKTRLSMEVLRDEFTILRREHGVKIMRGSCIVIAEYVFRVPKSFPKKKRELCLSGDIPHTSKPDINNLNSTLLDAMGDALIDDDRKVRALVGIKRYGEADRTTVTVIGGLDE